MRRIVDLLLLLIFIPIQPLVHTGRHIVCDRKLSAIARRLIHEAWLPVVTQYPGLRLPQHCPLHPWRDVHGLAELAKLHYRVNLWTCSQCGKSFNGEEELENHIAGRHVELFLPKDFSVCLADYCDILRCTTQRAVSRRPWTYRAQQNMQTFQVAKAPSRELVALIENSESFFSPPPAVHLPTSSCSEGSVAEHCWSQAKVWRTVARSPDNVTSCPDCYAPPHHRCDRVRMRDMKVKCEKLIDTCVNHLTLFLSDVQFGELRERLNSRVCWYLTCDRYWENQPRKKPSQPAGIFLVLIIAALIYFVFSYYVVWVCF